MLINVERVHRDARFRPVAPPRQPYQLTIISGRNLAKADRQPQERAYLAAGWLLGSVAINPPTAAMAARNFAVSLPLIYATLTELKATTNPPSPIAAAWTLANKQAREQFVKQHLTAIWDCVDRVTR